MEKALGKCLFVVDNPFPGNVISQRGLEVAPTPRFQHKPPSVLLGVCLLIFLKNHLPFPKMPIGEGSGTPLQYSCLENPMDGGAWWAAVHEVAESRI